jgi:antigen flippase
MRAVRLKSPQTDMRNRLQSLGNATATHLIGQVFFSATALLWAIVVARVLGVDGKGTVSAALLCASLVGAVGILGTREGLSFHVGRHGRSAVWSLLPSCVAQSLIVGVVGGCLAVFSRWMGVAALQHLPLWTVALAGLTAGAVVFAGQTQAIMVSSGQVLAASLITVTQMGSAILIFLCLSTLGHASPSTAVVAYFASLILVLAGSTYLIWRLPEGGGERIPVNMRGYWSYCLKALPTSLAQFLNFRFDQAVIAATVGPTGLGLYSTAVNVSEVGGYPAASLATVALPAIARSRNPRALALKVSISLAVVSIVTLLLIWSLGPVVIRELFGRSFAPSVDLLRILAAGAIAFGMARVAGSLAAGMGSPGVGAVAGLSALLITIPGCILLIPRYGIAAAAWVSVAAYVVALLVASVGLVRIAARLEPVRKDLPDVVLTHLYSDTNAGDAGITEAAISSLRALGYRRIAGWSTLPGEEEVLRNRLPFNAGAFTAVYPTVWAGIRDLGESNPKWPAIGARLVFAAQGARGIALLLLPGLSRLPIWSGPELSAVESCAAARLVVSKGGGFLYCETARQIPFLLRMCVPLVVAGEMADRVVLFGQTIGPLRGRLAQWIVRRTIIQSRAIVVARESRTAELLGRLGVPDSQVRSCPDTAFLLGSATGPRPHAGRGPLRVAISVRPWQFPGRQDWAKRLANYYDAVAHVACQLRELGAEVTLVAQVVSEDASEDDRRACDEIHHRDPSGLLSEGLQGPRTPEQWIASYSEHDIVIATRAHAAVFSICAGTPVVAISYGPKGIGMMESAGLGQFTLDIDAIDGEALLNRVEEVQRNYDEVQRQVAAKAQEYRIALREVSRDLFAGSEAPKAGSGAFVSEMIAVSSGASKIGQGPIV